MKFISLSAKLIMFDSNKTIVMDIQFVVGNKNQYFAKEIAYVYANSIVHHHFVFKPPFDYRELDEQARRLNTYNVINVNNLGWDEGYLPYSNVSSVLMSSLQKNSQSKKSIKTKIIVKGHQKKEFLLKYLDDHSTEIIDLDIGTSLSKIPNKFTDCQIHSKAEMRCAINNVYKLMFYLNRKNMMFES